MWKGKHSESMLSTLSIVRRWFSHLLLASTGARVCRTVELCLSAALCTSAPFAPSGFDFVFPCIE